MKWWEQRVGSLGGGGRAVCSTLCQQCDRVLECDLHGCKEVCLGPGAAWPVISQVPGSHGGALSRIDKFNLCLPTL